MPIDKRDSEDTDTLTAAKVMWAIVIVLIMVVLMAFVLGIAVHYVVVFFEKGWNIVD
jgi:flagellar basal body-associated protein FliL